jgi:beta-phosphoglucomutase
MSSKRAVLWDMDGVIVDSADYHFKSWRHVLEVEGFTLDYVRFRSTFGQRNDTILRDIFGVDYPDRDIARVGDAKEAHYRTLVEENGIDPLPGVIGWMKTLAEAGWKQAVASAAPRANVLAIVDELGIAGVFGALTGAEDVTRGKPDPQVYLTAAARLGVLPMYCVVIEDAPAGIEGAKRAGMKSIGVLTSHGELDGDIVVERLTDLDPDAFDTLIKAVS